MTRHYGICTHCGADITSANRSAYSTTLCDDCVLTPWETMPQYNVREDNAIRQANERSRPFGRTYADRLTDLRD